MDQETRADWECDVNSSLLHSKETRVIIDCLLHISYKKPFRPMEILCRNYNFHENWVVDDYIASRCS